MKKRSSKIVLLLSLLLVPFLIFSAYRISIPKSDFDVAKNLELYHSAVKNIRMYYVDDVDAAGLINESIQEFLNKLDPYTVFYSESTIEEFEFMNTGSYAGIGVNLTERNNKLYVTGLYANSPADREGVKAGDYIISVDGHEISDDNIDFVRNLLQGSVGSEVEIKVERKYTENGQLSTIPFKIKRERITTHAVDHHTIDENGIVYIKFDVFTQNSSKEFLSALQNYRDKNMKALVIDLRNNPGGFLQEAVNILDLFIAKDKTLVSTKGRLSQWNSVFKSKKTPLFPDLPIAVLVNKSSASASEIVAGVFQDYDRALIVGERTYGKGLVQITKDLGYNTKIKITTAKYYLPGGRCVQALDYSHLRDDGSVSEVPDSVKTAFKTENGRIFYDGGGVVPDLPVKNISDQSFIRFLNNEFIIHDYATKYAAEHDTTQVRRDFTFNRFSDFEHFLKQKNLMHRNDLQIKLESLAEDNVAQDLELSDEIREIAEKAKQKIPNLIVQNKSAVITVVEQEILARFYGESGRVIFSLDKDPLLKEAKTFLLDEDKYKSVLNTSE
jgi:carboxyl-terminal processing protease